MKTESTFLALKIHNLYFYFIQPFAIRNFRGTCSSVEMLKGYVVRERLGTPALYARLLVFDKTLAQPHFAVVNSSDAVR